MSFKSASLFEYWSRLNIVRGYKNDQVSIQEISEHIRSKPQLGFVYARVRRFIRAPRIGVDAYRIFP